MSTARTARTWPAIDALCAALQVINHLQDCAKDYRDLNRVYLPLDDLSAADIVTGCIGRRARQPRASPGDRAIGGSHCPPLGRGETLRRTDFGFRLGLEVSVIQALAESLNRGLMRRIRCPSACIIAGEKRRALHWAPWQAVLWARSARRKPTIRPALEP